MSIATMHMHTPFDLPPPFITADTTHVTGVTKQDVSGATSKLSIKTRIKATLSHITTVAGRTLKTGMKTVTAFAQKIHTYVRRQFRQNTLVARFRKVAQRFWARALRPLLRTTIYATLISLLVVGTFVNPILTIATLTLLGCSLHLLAAVIDIVQAAKANGSRAARVLWSVFKTGAQLLRAAVYIATALFVASVCAVSLSALVFVAMNLVLNYLAVAKANTISMLAYCAISGNIVAAVLLLVVEVVQSIVPRGDARMYSPATSSVGVPQATAESVDLNMDAYFVYPTASNLRARGTEEFWDTQDDVAPMMSQTCAGCGEDATLLVPSLVCHEPNAHVCAACAAAEVAVVEEERLAAATMEATALRHTGVSLTKCGIVVRLLPEGIQASPAWQRSREHMDHWHWLETAHYRPLTGAPSPREWSVLGNGVVQATVRYHYKRNVVQGFDVSKRPLCSIPVLKGLNALERAVACAQRIVTDELDRRDNLRQQTEHVEAPAPAPACAIVTPLHPHYNMRSE
jgi:hypothetical protein